MVAPTDDTHNKDKKLVVCGPPTVLDPEIAVGECAPTTKATKEKKGTKETGGALGVVFTVGHLENWDLNDLFKAVKQHDVRAILDARPDGRESGPAPEAVKVACAASGITYDRQPVLSNAYHKLAAQACGVAAEGCTPCVFFNGTVPWRLLQSRRCVSEYMKTKGIEVWHISWNGEIDYKTTEECLREQEHKPIPKPQTYAQKPQAHNIQFAQKPKVTSKDDLLSKGMSSMQKPLSKAELDTAAKPKATSETEATPQTMFQSNPKASSKVVLEDNAAKATLDGFPSSPLKMGFGIAPKTVLQSKPKGSSEVSSSTVLKATAKARFSNDGPRPPRMAPPGALLGDRRGEREDVIIEVDEIDGEIEPELKRLKSSDRIMPSKPKAAPKETPLHRR